MAKACAYLCRQCCFIDGFGEFGEYLTTTYARPHFTRELHWLHITTSANAFYPYI